jgi:hypothetical protein
MMAMYMYMTATHKAAMALCCLKSAVGMHPPQQGFHNTVGFVPHRSRGRLAGCVRLHVAQCIIASTRRPFAALLAQVTGRLWGT